MKNEATDASILSEKLLDLYKILDSEDANSSVVKKSSNDILTLLKNLNTTEGLCRNQRLEHVLVRGLNLNHIPIDLAFMIGNVLVKMHLKMDDFDEWIESAIDERPDFFGKLCLATGCINYGPKGKENLRYLLDIVICACENPTNHIYQSFQGLKLWSAKARQSTAVLTSNDKAEVDRLLKVINANWENPMRGVPDLLAETLANLLSILNDPALDSQLLNNALRSLSWKTKAKYFLLSVLLPRVGVLETLENEKDFGQGLCESLSSNHLASAGTSVYKAVVKTKNAFECWKRWMLPHLVQSLCHDKSSLVRCNARNHWLVPTITHLPSEAAAASMLDTLCSCDHCGTARFLIFKGLRVNGHLHELGEKHINSLEEGLTHSCGDVRIAAFAVICHVKKKAAVPSEEELRLAQRFIRDNLSVDDASFRQTLVSDFTQLMLRCRECCIGLHRKGEEERCGQVLLQMNAIMTSLFDNLFPGANYQRLISCLELLEVMHNCFFNYQPQGMNKGSARGDPVEVVRGLAQQKRGMMHFYTEHHLEKLLAAGVLHYMIDVKTRATQILAHFRPAEADIRAAFCQAIRLSCSSKFSECESAAFFFKLCLLWKKEAGAEANSYWLDLMSSVEAPDNPLLAQAIAQQLQSARCDWSLSSLLLGLYRGLCDQKEQPFLRLAKNAPMHGILTSLRTVLDLDSVATTFYLDLVNELEKSVHFMLGVLSGGSTASGRNASFAEMGIAVENMVSAATATSQKLEEDVVCISDEHSLVLACAWLNLKECCLVASRLFGASLQEEVVQRAGQLIIKVLTETRHKGALEAAASALADFCCQLLTSVNYEPLPQRWLLNVLRQIGEGQATSVTRRAAGLPLLVRAIVSAEQRGSAGGRRLLRLAVEGLLRILGHSAASADTSSSASSSETQDVPQCHALHVLKSLIHDSSLSHDVLPHLPMILRQCVEQFHSPLWAVRNAALQLFGALMPRILGQKKLRADEEEEEETLTMYNAVTAQELFCRHQHLAAFLLEQLRRCQSSQLNPSLVPILSMLSRVSPGLHHEDQQDRSKAFKMLFLHYLNHREHAVRKLAAKSLISFTAREYLMNELEMIQGLLRQNLHSNNFVHGCLMALNYGILLMKNECQADFHIRGDVLKALLMDIQVSKLCSYNRLILQNAKAILSRPHKLAKEDLNWSLILNHHPGARDLLIKFGSSSKAKEALSLDECKRFLKDLKGRPPPPTTTTTTPLVSNGSSRERIVEVLEFLEANAIQGDRLSGPMIEECNQYLQTSQALIRADCELAMDVLQVVTHAKIIASKDFGTTAASSSVATASVAFASMLMQDDFAMFFGGDGSTYVSLFGELADMVWQMAQSEKQEVIRLHAAEFILHSADIFTQRLLPTVHCSETCEELSIHMRYALVQVMNAALVLLSDENCDVRMKAMAFASSLEPRRKSVCRVKAIQLLTTLGLDCFQDCAEYFLPIIQLSNVDWTLPLVIDDANTSKSSSQLFESGDGINVYAEEAFSDRLYFHSLMKWMEEKEQGAIFRFLNCPNLLERASLYGQGLQQATATKESSLVLLSPKDYTNANKIFYFLQVVNRYPFLVANLSSASVGDFAPVIQTLRKTLKI